MKIRSFVFDPEEIKETMESLGIQRSPPHNNSPPVQESTEEFYESLDTPDIDHDYLD